VNLRKMRMMCALSTVLIHAEPAGAVTRYVDDDSANPQSPYTNAAYAATTIQAAVDVSVSNDLILVSAGLYDTGSRAANGANLKNRVLIDRPITVRGVDGRESTIIRGQGPCGNKAIRCVYLGPNAMLVGFTLTNGHTRQYHTWNDEEESGGGIYCHPLSGAVVSNCVISGCESYQHGGGAYRGTFHDCIIEGNRVLFNDGGGAAFVVLYDCIVRDNYGPDEGGGLYAASAYRCRIERNECREGGGMFFADATDSIICNNVGGFGGGAGAYSSLRNCLLYGNSATYAGGGACYAELHNCTVVSNSAVSGGGVYFGGLWGGAMTNCIVWANTGSTTTNANWDAGDGVIANSCTTPLPEGEGNITNAPAFVDPLNGDYHLLPSSPCIDAGDNAEASTPTDLDGGPRIVFGAVDMGAYEYVADTNDYDGDGMTNDDEAVAGTDATDPGSRLAVVEFTTTGGLRIVWVGGAQARQFVETKSDLMSITEPWMVIYTNEPPTSITNCLVLPVAPGASRFCRVRAESP